MPLIVRGSPWQNFARVMEARLATVQADVIAGFEATDPAYSVTTVTSLADTNTSGTLRYALSQNGDALIKFSVGGTITLTSNLNILSSGRKIVCGETASSPGITIRGPYKVRLTAPITFRHVRRIVDSGTGEAYSDRDGFQWVPSALSAHTTHITDCGLINCTVAHGTDETISFFPSTVVPLQEIYDVFVQDCLVAEGIWNLDIRPEDSPHRNGLLIGSPNEPAVPVKGARVQGNLFHSNRERNPRIGAGAEAWVLNNFITNAGRYWLDCGQDGTSRPTKLSYVGNVVRRGSEPETFRTPFDQAGLNTSSEIYWSDNYVNDVLTSIDDADIEGDLTFDPSVGSPPVAYPAGVSPISAAKTPWTVLTTAGACPWFRNEKDLRYIYEACTDTGVVGSGGSGGSLNMETFWPTGTDE